MAKGHDRHMARQQEIASLGRELSRRSRSKCELCNTQKSLKVMEIPPLPEDPDPDFCLLLCESCQPLVDSSHKIRNPKHLQFLHEAVWSEIQPVQIVAVRLTRRLADAEEDWAKGILENIYLDPDVEALI